MEFAVGTVLALAALAVSWIALAWQKRGGTSKRLHYTAYYELLTLQRGEDVIDSLIDGPISVNLEPSGQRLIMPLVFELRLANTGAAPITKDDFSSPLTIRFGSHCNFMGGSMEVNRGSISEFFGEDPFEIDQGCLRIKPFLMNPGDEVTLSGILNGPVDNDGIEVSGRIAGVETFGHLKPKDVGIRLKMHVRSMLFERMEDWPATGRVEAKVLVIQKFLPLDDIAPGAMQGHFSTRLNGVPVREMHVVAFTFNAHSDSTEDPNDGSITFETADSSFLHCDVMLDGTELSEQRARHFVIWNDKKVTIRARRIGRNQDLVVRFISEGDVEDLRITRKPTSVADVQIMRTQVVEDPLGRNLLDMQPRFLLFSQRAHRKFHTDMPRIKNLLQHSREIKKKILHGD
ncbi:hypothetical protein [Streptomyces longwoodensis]|uniref:hypothetical protein n=1 Tax=Streptomyces longwoodensis TaxID=68231 RepID=UPI000AF1AC60|nr:hypothetical protein [Streptomyces longwoodensis]